MIFGLWEELQAPGHSLGIPQIQPRMTRRRGIKQLSIKCRLLRSGLMQGVSLTIALLTVLLEGPDQAGDPGCGLRGRDDGVADEPGGNQGEGDVEAFL